MTVEQSPTPTPNPSAQFKSASVNPLPRARQSFEAACDSFESAWRNGTVPSIEEYLDWVDSADRNDLLHELVELDLFYRRQQGQTVQRSDYRSRFAALRDGSIAWPPGDGRSSSPLPAAADAVTPPVTPPTNARVGVPPQRGLGYEIISEIGRGGMGVVYLARQIRLNRLVALKMILAGEFASFEERVRFRREAETSARLQHPNIVQVYDVGEHDGQAYLAMEYVRGGTLVHWLEGLPRPPRQAAAMVETLANALQHAHDQGVIHRDLKPANILLSGGAGPWNGKLPENSPGQTPQMPASLPTPQSAPTLVGTPSAPLATGSRAVTSSVTPTPGSVQAQDQTLTDAPRPKIADFGLAKVLGHDVSMTRTGALLGTPSYMAPEATGGGEAVGPAADIYSLGAILYEALTGRPPFRGAHFADTLDQVRTQEPVTPRSLQPKIPRDLETICLKCLEKNPAARFDSAQALASDLRRFLNGEPIAARPIGIWESANRWMKRHPGPAVGFVSLSLTATIVLALSLFFNARLSLSLAETKNQREIIRRQRDEVTTQRDQLEQQQAAIIQERDESDRQRKAAEFATFTTEMLLADRYLQDSQHIAADQILRRHRPLPGQPDCRGFEWYYLWSRCHRETWSLNPSMGVLSNAVPSPDGSLLAICGNDGSIVLWDLVTHQDRFVLKPPVPREHQEIRYAAMMPGVAFSSNGRIVATCDGDVRLWDVATGRDLSPDGTPLQSNGRSIAFSNTGLTLGVGGEDGTLTLWDVDRRSAFRHWKAASSQVARIVFSPDQQVVVSIGTKAPDEGARFWNVQEMQEVHAVLHRDLSTVYDVAFSPDGSLVAVVEGALQLEKTNGRLSVLDTGKYTVRWSADTRLDGLHRVLFAADSQSLWTGADSGTLQHWTADTGQELPHLVGHVSRISSLQLMDSCRGLITSSYDQHVKCWDAQATTEPRVWQYPLSAAPTKFTVSPDNRRMAVADTSGSLQMWDLEQLQPLVWTSSATGEVPLQFTADGQRLLTGNPEALTMREVATGRPLASIDRIKLPRRSSPALSRDGHLLAMIEAASRAIMIFDVQTGKLHQTVTPPPGTDLTQVAFSPNSDRLAVTHAEGRKSFLTMLRVPNGMAAGGSPNRPVPNASYDSLRLQTLELGPPFYLPEVMVFSPDGQKLVIGGQSGFIMHCDLAAGTVQRVASHGSFVTSIAVDKTGLLAFSSSESGVIKLTDITRHHERFVLQYSTPDIIGLSLAEETGTLVTATKSGAFTFWKAPAESPVWKRPRSTPELAPR